MGRINNRCISHDIIKIPRKTKKKILIAVEGNNKTEKLYFNNFEKAKSSFNITYARGNNTDPLKLVKMLIKEIENLNLDLENGDASFCVFDVDMDYNKNKLINEAIQIALEKGIQIITSTTCVELWFLLHFEYTTSNLSNNDVIRRLRKFYPKYEKNINIYSDIHRNIDIAIKNAKLLEKYQKNNDKKIGTVDANPNTEMYKIVEYLTKKN